MRLAFIDLDGTIEDSREDMVDAVMRTRALLDLSPRPSESLSPFVNQGMDALYLNCFDDQLRHLQERGRTPSEGGALIARHFEAVYARRIVQKTRLYAGIEDSLTKLSKWGNLVLVTNKPEALSRLLLKELGILQHFCLIQGGDTCSKAKPDPEPLIDAAHTLGFEKENPKHFACMIGDSPGDLQVAKSFEIPSIWCAWGYAQDPGKLPPSAVANDPGELADCVAALCKSTAPKAFGS